MQSDFENYADADEPLQRSKPDESEEDEELDPEQELLRAAEFEFRESPVTFPGDPLA